MGKNGKVKKISGLQNGAIRGLQIRAGFRHYNTEQRGLVIGTDLGISNRGKKITNRGRDFKSGQRDFKSGAGITNQGRGYKLRVRITNRCRTMCSFK